MPDFEDKIPISEFSYTNTLHNTDQAPIIQQDGADWDNFRTSMADIGLHINKDMEYVTDLHTTSKKIIGAINELADGGGGSADIISEASGAIATFNDGGDNIPVKSLVTDITATQAGTGTPSPDNIRAITGVDAVDVSVMGKNYLPMFTPTTASGINYTVDNNGIVTASGQATGNSRIAQYLNLSAGTYTLSGASSGSTSGAGDLYVTIVSSGTVIARDYDGSTENTFTLTQTERLYIACRFSNGATSSSTTKIFYPQIERGETASEYNPYTLTTHTITLPETIYGGTAELVGGNGSKTYERVALDSLNWTYDTNAGHERFYTDVQTAYKIPATVDDKADLICEILQNASNMETFSHTVDNSISFANTGRFYLYISGVTDATALASIISGKYLVIELATPTAFTFTGANIPTLSGVNNIYSSTGDVEVEYFNENADQMAELIRVMTR